MISEYLGIVLAGILLIGTAAADARTWTNALGRTFDAEFVRLEGNGGAIFALPNGRQFSMPVAELSPADQARLSGGGRILQHEVIAASFGSPWPREVRLDGPVGSKVISEDQAAGRYIYESPGYRFTCDSRLTDDALRNFAVMFEATRKYSRGLPISLGAAAQRGGRLDILLFGTRQAYARAGGPANSAGVFSNGVVLVPMESLGLKDVGTGYSLDIRRHNMVLVHELAHQLTPETYFAPGARGWFSEGLAEYIAITPYTWGCFRTDVHGNVVKAYATARGTGGTGGRAIGNEIVAPKLRSFLLMPYEMFSGQNANFNYAMGLLLTHYFFHMEGGGKATRITKFLQGLHAGQHGEAALKPLLGGSTYEKLEGEISAAWARMGVNIRFGG
ncbi:MAG: hypothetical protein Q8Q59_15605 [Luteolibacter sp.]|jgi:hypothetical protein|nr:hypothetical protein [Luteolibacter sp.]